MILMREVMASRSFSGGVMIVLQHAVDAEPHAEFLLVRLDVNVAGAALDGVRQDQVYELDDGRFVGRLLQVAEIHLRLFGRSEATVRRRHPVRRADLVGDADAALSAARGPRARRASCANTARRPW